MICMICKKPVAVEGKVVIEVMEDNKIFYEHFLHKFDEFACCMESLEDTDDDTRTDRGKTEVLLLEAEIRGIRRYAWWKDGTQYVGSGIYTLKEALAPLCPTGDTRP